jgi:hypothetical protein
MELSDRRRQQRREIRLQQRESSWLQKALFALGKAEETREKLADTRDEEMQPYTIMMKDKEIQMEELEDALQVRIEHLMETVRERRRTLR